MSKEVLDKHFTLKTQYTALFKDRCFDDKMELFCNRIVFKQLTLRENDGEAVFYGRFLDTDAKHFVMQDSMRAILMMLDLWQYEEGTWPGFIIVFDLHGFKLGHMFKMEFGLIQQFLHYLEQAMLVQMKAIHFLNVPSFWKYLMSILRKCVKSELLEIVHIHHAASGTLPKFLPTEILSKEAGGNTEIINECRDKMALRMKMNNDYFMMENKKRVNESLRPGANAKDTKES